MNLELGFIALSAIVCVLVYRAAKSALENRAMQREIEYLKAYRKSDYEFLYDRNRLNATDIERIKEFLNVEEQCKSVKLVPRK